METFKVYVGCGLTHASDQFTDSVEKFKEKLNLIDNVEILDFLGLTDSTPRGVYNHDINNCVRRCDLLIAILDEPSTGLGVEFGIQIGERKKPMLGMAHHDSLVTRLVIDPGVPNYDFVRYQNLCVDGFELAKKQIMYRMKFWPDDRSFVTPDIPELSILGEGH